jgi:hypothetical protein
MNRNWQTVKIDNLDYELLKVELVKIKDIMVPGTGLLISLHFKYADN